MNFQSPQLIEAVNLWAGRGITPMPSRDEARVLERFGESQGEELMAQIKQLTSDFYASTAHVTAASVQDMAVDASSAFRALHPWADDEIVQTLAWCYTFDFK
jgi:hypothetical protein